MPGFDAILLTERDTNVVKSPSTGSRSPRGSRDTPVACRRRAPSAPGWHRGNVRGVGLVFGAKRKERSGMSENVDKVNEDSASRGEMGQRYLASGGSVSMRLWDAEEHGDPKPEAARLRDGRIRDRGSGGAAFGGRAYPPGGRRFLDRPEGCVAHVRDPGALDRRRGYQPPGRGPRVRRALGPAWHGRSVRPYGGGRRRPVQPTYERSRPHGRRWSAAGRQDLPRAGRAQLCPGARDTRPLPRR